MHAVTLTGHLDEPLSRWLWLIKWLLAIPHFLILIALDIAFFVCTVVAGFAILFTGRYPRGLFDFNVGVIRWNWRVAFYTHSAFATDRYPPFALRRTDYPADFDVVYPERLSRGLALVKWWLLAIPHYLVLAVLSGGWLGGPLAIGYVAQGDDGRVTIAPVLALVAFFAAVALLFTGAYPRGLFDFAMGINRWQYRVWAYAALMRDEYPPFRLDQGGEEPTDSTGARDVAVPLP